MIRVATVLDTWKTIREDTALAVEEFPQELFDFRPMAEVQTFEEIARHILVASHGILGVLLSGRENLQVPNFRELIGQHAPSPTPAAAELPAALRASMAERRSELDSQPAGFFSGLITRFDGMQVTRLEMIQFVKEHELGHRSQLFLYMRLKGLVPATTRRRMRASA